MKEFVLYEGEPWEVIREDCQGDKTHWLIYSVELTAFKNRKLRFVPLKDCIPLDPALNILFERNDDEQ